MSSSDEALRRLGQRIRDARMAAGWTQDQLGRKAGIVGKYVSEIERGTRDVPFSTLHAIVESGLGLHLDVVFGARGAARPAPPSLPRAIDDIARAIAALPDDERVVVVAIVRGAIKLAS